MTSRTALYRCTEGHPRQPSTSAVGGNLTITGTNLVNAITTGRKKLWAGYSERYATIFYGTSSTATGGKLANLVRPFTSGSIDFRRLAK